MLNETKELEDLIENINYQEKADKLGFFKNISTNNIRKSAKNRKTTIKPIKSSSIIVLEREK
jgi:hypothetical protein